MVYSLDDPWKCKLFLELCRRYGLTPCREKGQRSSTVQALAPRKFHQKTLWPEYLALPEELEKHLADRTDRVIREAIHADVSEAAEGLRRAFPSPSRDSDSSGRCGGRRRDHWRAGPRDVVLRHRQPRREVLLASEQSPQCIAQIRPWIDSHLVARRQQRERIGVAACVVVMTHEKRTDTAQ